MRGSITRLATRLDTLERKADQPATFDLAQDMGKKLANLDADFRKHHYDIVDHIDEEDEDTLCQEQELLDNHDDEIDDLKIRIKQLIVNSSSSTNSSQRKSINRKLSRLGKSITAIHDAVKHLTTSSDVCVVRQYQERLQDPKAAA